MDNQEIKTELIYECDFKPTLIDIEECVIKSDEYTHCTDIKTEFPVSDQIDLKKNKETLPTQWTETCNMTALTPTGDLRNIDILIRDKHGVEIGCDNGIPENAERVSVQPNSYSEAFFKGASSKYSRYLEIKNDLLNKKNKKEAEVILRDILLDGVSGIKVVLKDVIVVLDRLNLDAKRERKTCSDRDDPDWVTTWLFTIEYAKSKTILEMK